MLLTVNVHLPFLAREKSLLTKLRPFSNFEIFREKTTVKILKFGTPKKIAIIVLKIEKFDVTLHKCIQKMLMEWETA